ncbi:Putative permease [Halorhabdus sp. SVX81]|nr:Putative permease [Halorhabdus sp. SVX81]
MRSDAGRSQMSTAFAERERLLWVTGGFFGSQVAILLIAATGLLTWAVKAPLLAPLFAVLGYLLWAKFDRGVIDEWLQETWFFTRTIFPLLIAGTFVIGIIGAIAAIAQGLGPLETITRGGETFVAHQVAPGLLTQEIFGETIVLSAGLGSVIGAILYMPTLLEVPIIGSLFGYTNGLMADGPALSLLLAGPSLSLPNMLVIWKTIGTKRTALYVSLVAVAATMPGLILGLVSEGSIVNNQRKPNHTTHENRSHRPWLCQVQEDRTERRIGTRTTRRYRRDRRKSRRTNGNHRPRRHAHVRRRR